MRCSQLPLCADALVVYAGTHHPALWQRVWPHHLVDDPRQVCVSILRAYHASASPSASSSRAQLSRQQQPPSPSSAPQPWAAPAGLQSDTEATVQLVTVASHHSGRPAHQPIALPACVSFSASHPSVSTPCAAHWHHGSTTRRSEPQRVQCTPRLRLPCDRRKGLRTRCSHAQRTSRVPSASHPSQYGACERPRHPRHPSPRRPAALRLRFACGVGRVPALPRFPACHRHSARSPVPCLCSIHGIRMHADVSRALVSLRNEVMQHHVCSSPSAPRVLLSHSLCPV